MELQLKGKRTLVTGSSSGIGAGIARVLAAEGATVVVHGRDEARARNVADDVQKAGGKALVVVGDLATGDGCESVVDSIMTKLGGIDILVNNAGGKTAEGNPEWMEVGWQDWIDTYEQNVGATVRLIHRFVPGMKDRGWGRVIQISSAQGTQTDPFVGEYAASKAAMINLSSSLAKALTHTGVTVNTVSPGVILTPLVERWLSVVSQQKQWGDDWKVIEKRFTTEMTPLCVDHIGRPEDVGRVVALLASPLSSYITGANYRVDGGQCRSIN